MNLLRGWLLGQALLRQASEVKRPLDRLPMRAITADDYANDVLRRVGQWAAPCKRI